MKWEKLSQEVILQKFSNLMPVALDLWQLFQRLRRSTVAAEIYLGCVITQRALHKNSPWDAALPSAASCRPTALASVARSFSVVVWPRIPAQGRRVSVARREVVSMTQENVGISWPRGLIIAVSPGHFGSSPLQSTSLVSSCDYRWRGPRCHA